MCKKHPEKKISNYSLMFGSLYIYFGIIFLFEFLCVILQMREIKLQKKRYVVFIFK
jgi:hypothetical protein